MHWKHYRWCSDSLYLPIFWLDMVGNSFNLYDRYTHFGLIPHLHGTGAMGIVLRDGFGMSPGISAAVTNLIHTLLEVQEFPTDVFVGTHNVRG